MYKETKKELSYILKRYYKYNKKLQSLKSKKLLKYIVQDYKIDRTAIQIKRAPISTNNNIKRSNSL